MAKALSEQGEVELARQYAARCYEVSLRGGTEIDRARVELLGTRWPLAGIWCMACRWLVLRACSKRSTYQRGKSGAFAPGWRCSSTLATSTAPSRRTGGWLTDSHTKRFRVRSWLLGYFGSETFENRAFIYRSEAARNRLTSWKGPEESHAVGMESRHDM